MGEKRIGVGGQGYGDVGCGDDSDCGCGLREVEEDVRNRNFT